MLYGETGLCLGAWLARFPFPREWWALVSVPCSPFPRVCGAALRRWGDKIHPGGASFKGPRRAWAKGPLYNRAINFILLKEIYPIEE